MPLRSDVLAVGWIVGQSLRNPLNTDDKGLIDPIRIDAGHLSDSVAGNNETGKDDFRTGQWSTEDDVASVTEHVDNSLEAERSFCPDDHTGIPLFDG